jgi:hypothetical protein
MTKFVWVNNSHSEQPSFPWPNISRKDLNPAVSPVVFLWSPIDQAWRQMYPAGDQWYKNKAKNHKIQIQKWIKKVKQNETIYVCERIFDYPRYEMITTYWTTFWLWLAAYHKLVIKWNCMNVYSKNYFLYIYIYNQKECSWGASEKQFISL